MQANELPRSIEAEQALLSACLQNPSVFRKIKSRLRPDDFYSEKNFEIFKAMIKINSSDLVALTNSVDKSKVSTGYLMEIATATITAGWQTHADIIEDHALRREMWSLAQQASAEAIKPHSDLDEIEHDYRVGIYKVKQRRNKRLLLDNFDDSIETYNKIYRTGDPGVSCGIPGLERFYFEPSYLHCIAAESGVGKSALMAQVADYVASSTKKDVLYYTLESTKFHLIKRWLARNSRVALTRINTRNFADPEQEQNMKCTLEEFADSTLHFVDTSGIRTIEAMRSHIEGYLLGHNVSLVCIDFLQMLSSKKDFQTERQKINYFVNILKEMAEDWGVPILYACQLRKNNHERPKLDDLLESAYIRTHTDNIIMLYAPTANDPEYTTPKYQVECFIAKSKDQSRGAQWLDFNGNYMEFTKGTAPLKVVKTKSREI